jgi:hypothetical protein
MSTPKERVELELAELEEKYTVLEKLLSGEQPKFISEVQWGLLHEQSGAMWSYRRVLRARLANW